ncbi:hypothetical protein K8R03_03530 [Candidatus Kaiserbacteria bacterium]|nr:hypothetical protein [Candidatus Kaiserbacteria bacterium]
MFMPNAGGEAGRPKKVERLVDIGAAEKARVRGMENALKEKKFGASSGEAFDKEDFTEPNGAMFGDGEKGFLALTKSSEDGTAVIRHLRVEGRDPELTQQLLEEAISYLKDKGIYEVSISVSEKYRDMEHVLHDFGFHKEDESDDVRVFRAHL